MRGSSSELIALPGGVHPNRWQIVRHLAAEGSALHAEATAALTRLGIQPYERQVRAIAIARY
jgi:hypothetical protein